MSRAAATTRCSPRVQLLMPELGVRPENQVFVSRHRLLEPLPVLHEHLRRPQHPRARARGRDRRRAGPTRPRRLGRHRRRRRPVDRWQPPDPRAAPERELHDPALQQPDLRAHQGPVLADERGRARSRRARRSARSTTRSTRSRSRSARRRASSPAPTTWTASTCRRSSGARTSTRAPRSSRSTRTATCSTTARSRRSSPAATTGPRCSSSSRHGEPIRFGAEQEQGVRLNKYGEAEIVNIADVGEDAVLVHDEHRHDPTVAFALSRLAEHPIVPDARRCVPRGAAPDLRGRGAAPARRGPGDSAVPATSAPSSVRPGVWDVA